MKNADKFKDIFGLYASELWSFSEKELLEWINKDVPDINVVKWIPCKERLPQENDRYFVTVKHKGWGITTTDVLRWQGERWGWEEQSICTVLAWMPLPEPWRGEEG